MRLSSRNMKTLPRQGSGTHIVKLYFMSRDQSAVVLESENSNRTHGAPYESAHEPHSASNLHLL